MLCFLLALLCALPAACAEGLPGSGADGLSAGEAEILSLAGAEPVFPPEDYAWHGKKVSEQFDSDTLKYSIERDNIGRFTFFVTKIWVQDPERQIRKANAPWGKALANPLSLAKEIPGAMLATNASGYITSVYPDLPESYPGVPKDYYFTTLGSVVVTDGEILRDLEGVPFFGLALTEEGITLHRGTDDRELLAACPVETWAFFENCAMQENGENLLPEEGAWPMAKERHPRSVLARINRNNYLLLHVPYYDDGSNGLNLYEINSFFSDHFRTEWVYNLDGGYSTALIFRTETKPLQKKIVNRQSVADILCFTE